MEPSSPGTHPPHSNMPFGVYVCVSVCVWSCPRTGALLLYTPQLANPQPDIAAPALPPPSFLSERHRLSTKKENGGAGLKINPRCPFRHFEIQFLSGADREVKDTASR